MGPGCGPLVTSLAAPILSCDAEVKFPSAETSRTTVRASPLPLLSDAESTARSATNSKIEPALFFFASVSTGAGSVICQAQDVGRRRTLRIHLPQPVIHPVAQIAV